MLVSQKNLAHVISALSCINTSSVFNYEEKNRVKIARIRSFSRPYFFAVGLNTENYSENLCIQSEFGKIGTIKIWALFIQWYFLVIILNYNSFFFFIALLFDVSIMTILHDSFGLPKPSTIDFFLTNNSSYFQNTRTFFTGPSDFHKLVTTILKISIPKNKPSHINYRNYKYLNEYSFNEDLKLSFNNTDIKICEKSEEIFMNLLHHHALLKV